MDVPGRILTSPQITAVGATRAVGSMTGRSPECSVSLPWLFHVLDRLAVLELST